MAQLPPDFRITRLPPRRHFDDHTSHDVRIQQGPVWITAHAASDADADAFAAGLADLLDRHTVNTCALTPVAA